MVDHQCSAVEDPSWATRPHYANRREPLLQLGGEAPLSGVFDRSDLTDQPVAPNYRDRIWAFRREASVAQRHEEIENRWGGGEDLTTSRSVVIGWAMISW